jgi:NADH-quinone oxidoreductase subunit F
MTTSLLGEPTAVRVSGADAGTELLEAARGAAAVPVERVGSTGAAAVEPLLTATADGRTAFYYDATAGQAEAVARDLGEGTFAGDPDAVVEHDPGVGRLPVPASGPLSVGVRRALGRVGWVAPASPEDHAATGGFADEVGESALLAAAESVRGRGWGDGATDEPARALWETVREADGEPAVVVNAHGTPADRLLLEGSPLTALEGAVAAARAVGATEVVVFVSEADALAHRQAVAAAEAYPEPGVELRVATGPDEYIAAEETMALEAIEGNHRLEARLRPPGPAAVGLDGRPTLIHTPRTLAQVALALGSEDGEPTRLVTVDGDVAAPATVELPSGATLADAVEAVDVSGPVKAACVGGRFGGLTADLDVPVGAEALADADLGTEGVVELLTEGRCSVAFAGERARFAEEENCGRCVPCREGSTQLTELLREVYDGSYRPEALRELMGVIESTSICTFGVDAPRPVRTAMAEFEQEFEAHAAGRCPAGDCEMEIPT